MRSSRLHSVYRGVLFALVASALAALWIHGNSYYRTPVVERPFHEAYAALKPSGTAGHGYGLLGSALIIGGVILYSGHKRVRALASVGRITYFLDVHIFLCLLGPVLVLYHTSFKFGGIVGLCFWSMASVVASGIVGRYLYAQIPRGIKGDALTLQELEAENARLVAMLQSDYGLSEVQIRVLYEGKPLPAEGRQNLAVMIGRLVRTDLARRLHVRRMVRSLREQGVDASRRRACARVAGRRLLLAQRMAFLEQIRRLFYYWHVIHLPFTFLMFLTLAVHVGVALAFGYTWIVAP